MREELLSELVEAISKWPEIVAIAEGGSQARCKQDYASDLDLYLYVSAEVPLETRSAFIDPRSDDAELDNRICETGDEWTDRCTGIVVDMMYRSLHWIEGELARVLDAHQASLGYSTALWENVRSSRILFDPTGWYRKLQLNAARPYPQELANAIVEKNYRLLGEAHSAFQKQILKAASRNDLVSIHHRTTAFLACYFDVLFALNQVPHPGEKRLLELSSSLEHVPCRLGDHVRELMFAGARNETAKLAAILNEMIAELDLCLLASASPKAMPLESVYFRSTSGCESAHGLEQATKGTPHR
jgi:hypothetical protein